MPSSERCRLSLSSTFLGLARQFRSLTHEASFTSPEACMPKSASPMNAAVGFEKWGLQPRLVLPRTSGFGIITGE